MMVGAVFVIFKKWWQGMVRRGFRLTVTFPEGYAFNRTVICPLHAAKYNPKRNAKQRQLLGLPNDI
jgi:hypothetical protein